MKEKPVLPLLVSMALPNVISKMCIRDRKDAWFYPAPMPNIP